MGSRYGREGGRAGRETDENQVGACNIEARRIWLNLELAKKPVQYLEYIVVHEMAHLLERHHNDQFIKLMDSFVSQRRLHRAELNRAPLGHATWKY
jgi:predicted metal-dependent hydrolase